MDDHLRVSNADRDRATALLRAHFVAGRLTHDELSDRLAATLGAATVADLRRALADLPALGLATPHDSQLERGYRRLLALYPVRYRRAHEEEMLAVLMTGAAEGQDRPGRAEAADLIIGALRVRCQTLRGGVSSWRGAAALIGAVTVLGLLAGIPFASAGRPDQVVQLDSHIISIINPPASNADAAAVLARAEQYAVSSHPFLERAAVQALRSDVNITVRPERIPESADWTSVMTITVQASTAPQARRVANAVVRSYVASNAKYWPLRALSVSSVTPGPRSTDVLETSGLGAIWGALIGAAIALAIRIPRRRRPRTA